QPVETAAWIVENCLFDGGKPAPATFCLVGSRTKILHRCRSPGSRHDDESGGLQEKVRRVSLGGAALQRRPWSAGLEAIVRPVGGVVRHARRAERTRAAGVAAGHAVTVFLLRATGRRAFVGAAFHPLPRRLTLRPLP